MNIFASLITDMRQKKLWPFALLLVVLLVALPIVLTKSTSPIAITPVSPAPNSSALPDVPSITAQVNPVHSALKGHKRNPFTPSVKPTSPTTTARPAGPTTASPAKPSGSSAASAPSTTHAASTPAPSAPATPSRPATAPAQPATPLTPAKRPPAGLSPLQVYDVRFATTNAKGGFYSIDPLERLSVVPNAEKPLLVEQGVLDGGHRVLFAVLPGTAVSGPGTCLPGPINCQVLALRENQIEQVSGLVDGHLAYAEIAVTRIAAHKLRSKAAAGAARRRRSSAGRSLLDHANLPILSLFRYHANLGTVLDLRNLSVGAS